MSSDTTQEPAPAPPPEAGRSRARGRLHRRLHANPALALTTKVVVTVVGVLVMVAGAVMLVAPGPGLVGIAVGLGILATEWEWAERWLVAARRKAHEARERAEAMDPKVRRRRIAVGAVSCVVLAGVAAGYVAAFDWPGVAVDGWDLVQQVGGWVPELPGM